ncbi:MAG TPA: hypothetical protein VI279_09865 [Rhodocyclaceae bacterium]
MAILGFFSKEKGDHPLADSKEAKEALAGLVGSDPTSCLEDVRAWIESLIAAQELRLERRVELLLQLDETGTPFARRLARDYLTTPLNRSQEYKLWQVGAGYWRELGAAYADCLARAGRDSKGLSSIKGQLALLHARWLHAEGGLLKWSQFRYGPPGPEFWGNAGAAYIGAASLKVVQRELSLYPNWPGETTVEREYLKLLVFHASAMDKLLPLEVELAERLIAHFLPLFEFTDQVRPENVYWVDTAKSLPPSRLIRVPEAAPSLRYFSTGKACSAIEVLRGRITQGGSVPSDVPLGGQYPPEVVAKVLAHLALCCAPTPPARASDRHRVKSLAAVVHGMAEVRARLQGYDGSQDGETWVVEDVSLGGMGAQVSLVGNDWLRIGALVALRPEGGDNWLVGVVRRFGRASQTVGSVGIETLGRTPKAANMECSGLRSDVVMLETGVEVGGEVRVLMPPGSWEDFLPVIAAWEGERARLKPEGIYLDGREGLVGRFRVEEREIEA